MIYEYCDEIKNSGIDKNFPTSGRSYLEMALDASYTLTLETNNIFQECGLLELKKFSNATITEASAGEIFTAVKTKIANAFIKFFEKIKQIWGAIQGWFEDRINSIKDSLLKRFKEIDFENYKKTLDKIDTKINLKIFDDNGELSKIVDAIKGVADINNGDDPFPYIATEIGLSKVHNLETAKAAIDKKLEKPELVSCDWLIKNRDEIIKVLSQSARSIGDDYRNAKQEADKTVRKLKEIKESDAAKDQLTGELKMAQAKQQLLIYVAKVKKTEFIHLARVLSLVNMKCNPGNEEKPIHASAKFDVNFVDKVFNG